MGDFAKKAQNAFVAVGFPFALYSTANVFYATVPIPADSVQSYLSQNASRIHREVEERYGISISSVNLEFKANFDDGEYSIIKNAPMKYKEGTIYVNQSLGSYSAVDQKGTEASFPYNLFLLQKNPRKTVECIYVHELGHHKVHQIKEQLAKEGKYHRSHVTLFLPTLASRITNEGLAEHFCQEFYGSTQPVQWVPSKIEDYVHSDSSASELPFFFGKLNYWRASQVFKPVLDSCGIDEGTRQVFSQPQITEQEMLKPSDYQARITKECKQ